MKVTYLKLDTVNIMLLATVDYGEEYTGPLNCLAVLGYFNDGINYSYTDKNGNKYIKSGNTVSITNSEGSTISATATEGSPFLRIKNIYGNKYGLYSSNSRTRVDGEIRSVAIFNDASAYTSWIESNYSNGEAVSALWVSKDLKGVWNAKNNYSGWSDTKASTNDCFSDGSSYIIQLNVDGVLVEGGTLNPDDPYSPGGSSDTGGGTGNFDGTGDDVDIPSLPTLSAVDTGFITLFNPSAGELRNLSNYMWGDLFDVATWKKIFANPMDAILGLSIVPVSVPNGGQAEVTVGNISTGISMNKASAQYISVDCGTLNVNEYWGSYLDYDPYTKAEIYLPYIGIRPLSVGDIMNKAVHVVYHIDILSGACCAYVKCGGSVLYSFVGQCSCSIPITGNDWTNVVNGALSIAASIGTMVATGGATAPMAATTIASTAVNSMKPNIEKSGSMGGMGGMLGVQTPYLIITRPRQALPARQNSFMGYPSFITLSLGECSGYTEIESVHLENIPATKQELLEIESLLKGGVIL